MNPFLAQFVSIRCITMTNVFVIRGHVWSRVRRVSMRQRLAGTFVSINIHFSFTLSSWQSFTTWEILPRYFLCLTRWSILINISRTSQKGIKKIGTFIENFASDVMIHVPPIVMAPAARILVFVKTMELVIQWMDPAPVHLDGR